MARWLERAESSVCGTLLVLLSVVAGVSLMMVTWPLALSLALPAEPARCRLYRNVTLAGVTNCTDSWSSCRPGCSQAPAACSRLYAQFWLADNSTSVAPLVSNVLGCGFFPGSDCGRFDAAVRAAAFDCHLYPGLKFAVPDSQNDRDEAIKYSLLSLAPLAATVVCCVYMCKRKMFAKGVKKVKRIVKLSRDEPRSFYQKKIRELEFKKNLRLLKMKNTQNDVKVFELDNAQTTGALILKPSFSMVPTNPPRIIV